MRDFEVKATTHGLAVEEAMRAMQERICAALGAEDGQEFASDPWLRAEGGGGISRVLEEGALFEKGGVMFSAINGNQLPQVVLREHPEIAPDTPFFATGVSLIMHPRNPYVPTVHYNVRYFEVGEAVFWYGGGMDLTPYYPFEEDCRHFHRAIKGACDAFDPAWYPEFKAWCDRYFFLPHRNEARGVGGIFFNYMRDDRARGLDFITRLGEVFLEAYLPIVQRRRGMTHGERERGFQAYRRGRYVEFNLLHDQGTLFGLQSGGRVESILVSMPPRVAWHYRWEPEPGSPEEALTRDFLPPRDWASE